MRALPLALRMGAVSGRAATRRCSHTFLLACVGVLTAAPCSADDVLLRWTVPPGLGIAGYRVYNGLASRAYDPPIDVGSLATSTFSGVVYYLYQNLPLGTPEYVAVTAYDSLGTESDYSNEKTFNLTAVIPPSVDAGLDQSVTVGSVVSLGGIVSFGTNYFWQQTAGPPAVLSSRTTSATQFTPQAPGTYRFDLTAYDVLGAAARDSVTVDVVAAPTATATITRTPTRTLPPTSSRTPTRSPSATATRTPTPSNTASRTATPTVTQTRPTATRTRTPSPTVTVTATATPSGLANDTCENALQITAVPFAGTVVTTMATTDASDPAPGCGNNSRSKSVWYRFTVPHAGALTAATFGSSYDTILAAFRGSCGAFTPVIGGCNDDSSNLQSRVVFQATAGTTYYFLVTAYASNGGTLKFSLSY